MRWCTWLTSLLDTGLTSCCFDSASRRLFVEAKNRLHDELNVAKLLKRVRNSQVILESTFLGNDHQNRKRLLTHTAPNIIDFEAVSRRTLSKASRPRRSSQYEHEGGDYDLGIEIAISPRS